MPNKLFMPTHPSSPFSHAYTRTHHQPYSSPPGLAQCACYIKASAYGSRVGWTPARTIHTYISPILEATPFPRVQARRPQIYRSPPPFPLYPYRLGAVGPKVGQKWGASCKIRPQWPKNRCIQFLLQKCEIGVILSDMFRHARPTASA